MKTIEVKQHINAPPEAVWRVVTDVERWTDVIDAIKHVEKLEGDGFGPGFKWRETRVMMGREASEEMWVDEIDDGRSYVVLAASHGMRYRSEISVQPEDGGTRLTYTFGGTAESLSAKVISAALGWMMAGASAKALAQDLVDIGKAAEALDDAA